MIEVTAKEESRLKGNRTTWINRCFAPSTIVEKNSPMSFTGTRGMILAEDGKSARPFKVIGKAIKTLDKINLQDALAEGFVDVEAWMKNWEQIPGYKGTNKCSKTAVVTRLHIQPIDLDDLEHIKQHG